MDVARHMTKDLRKRIFQLSHYHNLSDLSRFGFEVCKPEESVRNVIGLMMASVCLVRAGKFDEARYLYWQIARSFSFSLVCPTVVHREVRRYLAHGDVTGLTKLAFQDFKSYSEKVQRHGNPRVEVKKLVWQVWDETSKEQADDPFWQYYYQ